MEAGGRHKVKYWGGGGGLGVPVQDGLSGFGLGNLS